MYRFTIVFILSCMLVATSNAGQKDANKARRAIVTVYAKMTTALKNGDAAAYVKYLDDEFEATAAGGVTISRSSVKERLKTFFETFETTSATIAITKFKLNGKEATVTVTERVVGLQSDTKKGTVKRLELVSVDEDTWTLTKRGWVLDGTKILKQKELVNGKEVTPSNDDDGD